MPLLRQSTDDKDASNLRNNGFVIVTAIIFVVAASVTSWAAPFVIPGASGPKVTAFWIASLIAVITFIMLLRAVVEMLVEPQVRMRRVLAYGVVIVSMMFVSFWLWEFFKY